jgi:hypothetical protein
VDGRLRDRGRRRAFHQSTLTYWVSRLAASTWPLRIFEVVQQLTIETGAVTGKTPRALDSAILDNAGGLEGWKGVLMGRWRRS